MFELRHLRHAIGLADHQNYARAAQVLHISQPALSRSIQSLEEQLGVRLFDRDQGGVQPTIYGNLLLGRAREIDLAASDLLREVELAKGLAQGELKIGVGPWGAAALAGDVVGAMSRAHPQLRLNLVIGPWKELPARLNARQIDFAVVNISEMQSDDELDVLPLREHPVLLLCRAGHPLTYLSNPSMAQVLKYPLAGPEMPQRATELLLSELPADVRALVLRQGLVSITCDSSFVLKSIVAQSDAITFFNAFMALDEIQAGVLKVVPSINAGPLGQFGVVRLRRRSLSSAAQTFISMLIDHDKAMSDREKIFFSNEN
ncbi:MAG: LysR family transcriptional regulator [Betaproteobacteria bacterium]|jgi:DNA-binding transcriptional LysR family regulator|nr:LysR family transcriptional regulator [Betaproteobacteria bacterium]MBP6644452.1 LysR family transcriptional regulator [Burkholderiaceae bacterium]